MTPKVCIVDTSAIVSGLLGADSNTPPVRILDAMLDGTLLYLMSSDLLDEYSSVLHRPSLVRLHGRTDDEIDRLLAGLVADAMWREPAVKGDAPDPGDDHLWALLASCPRRQLVTGDRLLLENPPGDASVTSPRHFAGTFAARELIRTPARPRRHGVGAMCMDRYVESTINACTIPGFAEERLNKAQGHINVISMPRI